jgi:hypothetical protein
MAMTGKQQATSSGVERCSRLLRASMRGRARVVVAAVLLAASVGVLGTGLSVVGSTGVTLDYTCTLPLPPFPEQPMVAQVTWKPAPVIVGQATPVVTISATAMAGPAVTSLLGVEGAATVEGSVEGPGTVVAPEGTISSSLKLIVPRTGVPASGPMTVSAAGTTPSLVFHQPGHATVNVGSALVLHVALRDSGGNPTAVSNLDVSCTLDSGQDTVVYSFDIMPMPSAPPATTTATTGPVPAPTVTAPPATVRPPDPTSSTAQPVVPTATPPPTSKARVGDRAAGFWHALVGWWLAAAAILAAVAGATGGVWWHMRRRRVLRH